MVVRSDGNLRTEGVSEIYRIEQMMMMLEHHLKHVATHFFDKRFTNEQFERQLRIMGRTLISDHQEFRIPYDGLGDFED